MAILTGRPTISTTLTGRTLITTKSYLLINDTDFLLINSSGDRLIISEQSGTPLTGRIIPT